MLRTASVFLMVAGVLVLSLAGQALAQSRPAGPGPGAWGGPGGQMDPEQMKKMMEQFKKQAEKYMQDALGATDEEWTVLSPKVEKVQTLTTQTMAFGGGRMMGFGQPTDDAQKPDVTKKLEALRKLLQNKEAKAEDINTALKEYRDARAKSKEDLEKAQKDLKDVLTARQEALMVTMGMLP